MARKPARPGSGLPPILNRLAENELTGDDNDDDSDSVDDAHCTALHCESERTNERANVPSTGRIIQWAKIGSMEG